MNSANPKILIADDQPDVLEALRLLLKAEGWQIEAAASPGKVLALVAGQEFEVALIDLNYARDTTSGKEGLELMSKLIELDSSLPIVVMTAWGSVEVAVEAMRRGARDFIQKPWENERLLAILRTQAELSRALRQGQKLAAENELLRAEKGPAIVAESAAMQPVLEMIARVAPSDANVLVTGENGTGKGVIARALHAASARAHKALVTVNVGGLSEGVFESELFGHVKGAFTDARADRVGRFELADGGTLFLDEIANVPTAQQPKMLRVLETGEFERVGSSKTRKVNVRIVSATNAELKKEVEAGHFRRDLLFRLNTIEIHLPPLRERREDIAPLAHYFLRQQMLRYRKVVEGFEANALQAMLKYDWPGNVRELEHMVERAILMTNGTLIRANDLGVTDSTGSSPGIEDLSLEEVEAWLIKKSLARCDGNVSRAAEALGLSRSALYRRLEKYGL